MKKKPETTIRERPILFSGPMVRAILEGRKTMTRRIVKHPPFESNDEGLLTEWAIGNIKCPYGQPGDRLWVRETWINYPLAGHDGCSGPIYRADVDLNDKCASGHGGWKPSIFMPRWASRINLEITDIKVERLREISEEDAKNEGVECNYVGHMPASDNMGMYRFWFKDLWDHINKKRGYGWDVNPYVWVVSFKRIGE